MAKKDKYGFRESFPRFFKAERDLQAKVGTGTLDAAVIARAQDYMNSVSTDIAPVLRDELNNISAWLTEAKKITYNREEFLPRVIKPIMNVKSLSGMFRQQMACRIAAFVLTFLEDVKKFDNDIVEILEAYVKVTRALLELKIEEENNPHGQSFLIEIRNACKRYYDKHAENVRG